MSDERRRRLDDLFDEILDAPISEREGILARAGEEDPELRRELEALLAAHERAGGILDTPPGIPTSVRSGS